MSFEQLKPADPLDEKSRVVERLEQADLLEGKGWAQAAVFFEAACGRPAALLAAHVVLAASWS